MQTLIFAGPAGVTATAAAATAAAAAAGGARTLLAGIGPAHPAAALVAATPSPTPVAVAPGLDAWLLDPLADLAARWQALARGNAQVGADELPLVPGADLFLAVSRLRELAADYDLVCVDAGPPDALLRALAVPDAFRWAVRLLLGLDRGPGRSSASVGRAIVPTAILPIPMEWLGQVQDARVHFEHLRDEYLSPTAATVRLVLRPDPAGLAEARLVVPALQLFGLAVEGFIAGPLLPDGLRGGGVDGLLDEQAAALAEVAATWPDLPVLRLPASPAPVGAQALTALGRTLYAEASPLPARSLEPTVRLTGPPEPQIAIDLPGLAREALGLAVGGDELIVRVGPYRRHILMPEGLRGAAGIRAARQGDTLTVRPRT